MSWMDPYSNTQKAEIARGQAEKKMLLKIDTATPMYFCTGEDSIEYDSNLYRPRPFQMQSFRLSSQTSIIIANTDPRSDTVMSEAKFTEGTFGGLTCQVFCLLRQKAVEAGQIDRRWRLIAQYDFVIRHCEWTATRFRIHVKDTTAVRRRQALSQHSSHCDLEFKGPLCGYSGGESRCQKTWDDCVSRSNTAKFRGMRFAPPHDFKLVIDYQTNRMVRMEPPRKQDPGKSGRPRQVAQDPRQQAMMSADGDLNYRDRGPEVGTGGGGGAGGTGGTGGGSSSQQAGGGSSTGSASS